MTCKICSKQFKPRIKSNLCTYHRYRTKPEVKKARSEYQKVYYEYYAKPKKLGFVSHGEYILSKLVIEPRYL